MTNSNLFCLYFVTKLSFLKQSPAVHRVHLPAKLRASTHRVQRTELAGGQLSRFHHKRFEKTNGLQIRQKQTQWTIMCGVQCWRLTASLKQSRKQSPNSRNRFRLSGATYHKDVSTRLWKTSQIKRLKACVGAWSCRWILRSFTVTMEFWHLIIS